jgi:hypothetical protein
MNIFQDVCISIIIFDTVLTIIFVLWINYDANERGKNGNLWALFMAISMLLPFLGLLIVSIIWLLIRPPKLSVQSQVLDSENKKSLKKGSYGDRVCPECSRKIPVDANFCPYCFKKFDSYFKG